MHFNQFTYAQNTVVAIIKERDFSLVTISSHKFTGLHYWFNTLFSFEEIPNPHYFNMPQGEAFTKPKKLSDDLADICGVEVCIC